MQKKFLDILRIVQKNPVFGKKLMCSGMLDEKRMEILYEILYAIDREEFTDTRNDIFQYGSLIGKKDLLARQIFLCLLILLDEQEQMIRKWFADRNNKRFFTKEFCVRHRIAVWIFRWKKSL